MHPIALVSWLHADVGLSPSRTQAGHTHTKNSPVTALAAQLHCTLRTPSSSRSAPQQIPSLFDTHRLSHAKAASDLPLFCRLDTRTRKHLRNSSTIYFHRNNTLTSEKERSWFGPNGQYIRELPCPSCRGRGYTPCPECGVDRTRPDCFQCTGKGVTRCWQCLGECVIWEESYDERPWEKVLSSSLFKVKEDDEVDSLDIKVDATRKSKRVYRTLTPEVSLKISRSLRNLNAKTGLFSKRMKIIHQDPVLHGQRVAAIKKTKGTPAARKRASDISKAYFTNPEHRLKRSMAMKGVKFYCSHCGEEGHRRHYCQVLRGTSTEVRFRCSLCGVRGHNLRTCGRTITKKARTRKGRPQHFKLCSRTGELIKLEGGNTASQVTQPAKAKRAYSCKLCLGKGHNSRTCPTRKATGETSTSISVPEQQTIS